jgi:Holliday junction resolvasome RuvABC endonuclease subunit
MGNKKVMGLDLSLSGTGLIVLEDGKLLEQKLIKSKPFGEKPVDELRRLNYIAGEIDLYLVRHAPSLVAIEGLAFGITKTTSIMQLAGLNYLVRRMLHAYGFEFVLVAPSTLKKFITGKGSGPKDIMMLESYKRYGVSFGDNNLADGFGLAQMAHELLNDNKLPSFQKESLDVVRKQLQ